MDVAILTENLTKVFGDGKGSHSIKAVDNLNLVVHRGTFFGFVGPNGAGKTTTVNMLTGLLRPTSGRIEILGMDFERHSIEIKRRIGVVPEGLNLYEQLTGEEYLYFVGRMYGLPRREVRNRSEELFSLMGMEEVRRRFVYEYSSGMRKKLALSAALIHDPGVLFLDEPFEGIDVLTLRTIRNILTKMVEKGRTIFLTSHILEVVERLCSEVAIIDRGKIVFTGSSHQIRERIEEMGEEPSHPLEALFFQLVAKDEEEKSLSWLR